ncbi:MAG: VWA domain-containing protein, partial [Bacteroidales bacterium]|nr:VWA domain-containing protein [Bacteroidales bacterium]
VTARLNHPYVKIFEEERELTVMLLIDVSGSNNFGTHVSLKKDMIAELAAVLAFSAIQNNDKVGVIFFSNKIEKFIPPKKGSTHILRIIRELITFEPENTNTDIAQALKYFTNVIKKRSTTFIISDFYDRDFDEPFKIAAKKHDLVALRIADRNEQNLPHMGLVNFFDQESQKGICIDTSDENVRKAFAKAYAEHEEHLQNIFTKYGIDNTLILTDDDYVKPLMKLFKMRGHKM